MNPFDLLLNFYQTFFGVTDLVLLTASDTQLWNGWDGRWSCMTSKEESDNDTSSKSNVLDKECCSNDMSASVLSSKMAKSHNSDKA